MLPLCLLKPIALTPYQKPWADVFARHCKYFGDCFCNLTVPLYLCYGFERVYPPVPYTLDMGIVHKFEVIKIGIYMFVYLVNID